MNRDSVLLSLLVTFAPLSLLTIGGGISIVGDIQRAVVDVHHWVTPQGFVDLFAISRAAPGPGTLLVTLLGWQVAGLAGAIVASLAIFVPSSLLVYGVAWLWHNNPGARWQRPVTIGLAPVAAGLVLSSVFKLLVHARGGWITFVIAGLAFAAALHGRIGPLALMGLGAVAFLALSLFPI